MPTEYFEKNYVWNPNYYGMLMNGNITRKSFKPENKERAIALIQDMVNQEENDLIDAFLKSANWRGKTVAGCLIGFKNQPQYISQIGRLLINNCGGVTGYCYAFARFADDESVAFLTAYLDKFLPFEKWPEEKYQDWAFSALRWIDKKRGTRHANEYLKPDGLWTQFVNFKFVREVPWSLGESPKWGNLEASDIRFSEMMAFYKTHFEVI